jgi:hypothetical protein
MTDNRLYEELRRRFASPQEALRALGLDESLLRKGEVMLTEGKLRHLSRHARTLVAGRLQHWRWMRRLGFATRSIRRS